MHNCLLGKTALITGASKGIGAAIAKLFAKAGAYVYINYNKSTKDAEAVLNDIKHHGGEGELIQASVAVKEEVETMFQLIKDRNRGLHILVNNAGITKDNFLGTMSEIEWCSVINTNLNSVYFCSFYATRIFIAQKFGNIINISSVSGVYGAPGQVNYASAKAGIIGFTKAAALELGRFNIHVNAIAPGYIDTDMFAKIPPNIRNLAKNQCALQRVGKPEEVANVALFLASDNASYIQGQVILVDGGLL